MFCAINSYQKLSKHQIFQLFWFEKMVVYHEGRDYDYIKDFHITYHLINHFNHLILMSTAICDEGNVRFYLLQEGLRDVDDADVKNVLMAAQVYFNQPYPDARYIGDVNIRVFVSCYLEWMKYFYYSYDTNPVFKAKPVIWDNIRRFDEYTISQIERGAVMEEFVDDEFKKCGVDIGFYFSPKEQYRGECAACIEVKHDMRSEETENFYIECYERHFNNSSEEFRESGVLKRSNTLFWIIGTPNSYVIVQEEDLRRLFFSMNPNNSGWQNGRKYVSSKSSKGFIVKKYVLEQLAVAASIREFVNKYYKSTR